MGVGMKIKGILYVKWKEIQLKSKKTRKDFNKEHKKIMNEQKEIRQREKKANASKGNRKKSARKWISKHSRNLAGAAKSFKNSFLKSRN
jgi:hemerythrin